MHSEPMPETAGEFTEEHHLPFPCRKCGQQKVVAQTWESSCGGYVDDKYTCKACGYVWWVEGPDS